MANWVDAKSAAEALGIKPMRVRQLARKYDAPHRRDGKRVYFDLDTLQPWYKKFKQLSGKAKTQTKGDTVTVDLDKLPRDQNFVMWDRGDWRGWAVAHPKKVSDEFVQTLVDYTDRTLFFDAKNFKQDLAEGKVFIVEPDQAIQFIIVQLLRLQNDAPKDVLRTLQQAVKELQQWREEQEAIAAANIDDETT